MTTISMTDQRVTIPVGLDGLIVRLGLAISRFGVRRAERRPGNWAGAEQAREGLSPDLIFYRMR